VEAGFPSTPLGGFLRPFLQLIYLTALYWGGHVVQARSVAARAITSARQLSDPHIESCLRVSSGFRLLAQDDAEGARQEWESTLERYPAHWIFREALWGWMPALYAGELERAELVLAKARGQLLLSDMYSGPLRTFHIWSWGAVAAARLAGGEATRGLKLRLWLAAKLTSYGAAGPAKALARSLEAARAFLDDDHDLGMSHLQSARDLFAAGGLRMYAAAASYVLSQQHDLEPVREQHHAYALEIFGREKLERPERWVRALLPGVPEELYAPRDSD
jgi:hypothetical protein